MFFPGAAIFKALEDALSVQDLDQVSFDTRQLVIIPRRQQLLRDDLYHSGLQFNRPQFVFTLDQL